MTETETKWSARVEAWRASGKTAEEFAAGQGYQPSTLTYWASRLKTRASSTIAIARVVRRGTQPAGAEGIEVILGSARVVVRRGFDVVLFRELVNALEGDR